VLLRSANFTINILAIVSLLMLISEFKIQIESIKAQINFSFLHISYLYCFIFEVPIPFFDLPLPKNDRGLPGNLHNQTFIHFLSLYVVSLRTSLPHFTPFHSFKLAWHFWRVFPPQFCGDGFPVVCEPLKLISSYSVSIRYNFKQFTSRFLCSLP
jgi:hypothetical protein